jgi:hypothetical protein
LLVGTLLFAINQLDVVVRHHATALTVVQVALTYLLPFGVSNYGILVIRLPDTATSSRTRPQQALITSAWHGRPIPRRPRRNRRSAARERSSNCMFMR